MENFISIAIGGAALVISIVAYARATQARRRTEEIADCMLDLEPGHPREAPTGPDAWRGQVL